MAKLKFAFLPKTISVRVVFNNNCCLFWRSVDLQRSYLELSAGKKVAGRPCISASSTAYGLKPAAPPGPLMSATLGDFFALKPLERQM